MCGIAGRSSSVRFEAGVPRELAASFGCSMRLRGPNSDGWHHDQETLLVHRRLSIVDLSEAGRQPMWNEDGTVCVLVNGEIYNFEDLREALIAKGHRFHSRSDSEVIVHAYEEYGIRGMCTAIEGMFAFALWDARRRDLFLVRDRLGIKPLVIAEHAEGVTFASTMSGLLADPAVPRAPREEAFVAVMRWGFVPTPWSALRCARHLLPGTYLRVREGRVVEDVRWWQDEPAPKHASPDSVRTEIEQAVRSHLVADVPIGVLLSAGIDSGIVTALGARATGPGELEAWTVSQRGYPEDEFADASRTARFLGIRVHEIPVGSAGATGEAMSAVVEAMDEPLAISSLVGLHALFRAIAPDRRVVLSGDGGDELFAGYDWHIGMPQLPWWSRGVLFRAVAPLFTRSPASAGRGAGLAAVATLASQHEAQLYLHKLRIASDEGLAGLGLPVLRDDPMEQRAIDIWDRFASAGTLEQMLAVDRGTALIDEMLAKLDTASMAYSVEARVPFLGDRVLAAAKGLASPHKRIGGRGKILLREWFHELGPPGASVRPKTGFNSPVHAWFSGAARDYFQEHLALGARLLGISTLPTSPRLMFACAILGAWNESRFQDGRPSTRGASETAASPIDGCLA